VAAVVIVFYVLAARRAIRDGELSTEPPEENE
jgi:hypothetical protein